MNEELEPSLCEYCKKKLKKNNWYKCYDKFFCNLKCLTHWEEEHG
jgi:hypothetical protein